MLRVKLVRSPIGYDWRQRRTVAALGLRKMNQVKEHEDNDVIRGMIRKVTHLVEVETAADGAKPKAKRKA